MRRTYKSKKEINGALDPRDVLLTMDPKSSIFDAFYIQNIKQTKRDMSVGASVQFAASNKVRERKYVKRVKEQEVNIRDSCNSAYLTPDKSLRVNKPADLFDQLLASSPIDVDNKQTVNKLNNVHNQFKRKHYKRMSSKKKRNYSSSESTDSDKENSVVNSSKENIITHDVSDILCHKLEIEKENKSSLFKVDESIDKIAENLSIFSESKPKDIESPQCPKSIQMLEVMANSPLCSTPFHEKYRGKSIYRFSPIRINLNDSPIVPAADENSVRENTCLEGQNSIQQIPSKHNSNNEIVSSPILQNKSHSINFKKAVSNAYNKTCESYEVLETKSLQSTEMEPFLGFSKNPDNFEVEAIVDKYKQIERNLLGNEQSLQLPVKSDIILCDTEENVSVDQSKEVLIISEDENSTLNSESTNNESNYDTCEEDESMNNKHSVQKDLIVVVDRLNDSLFQKFYSKMPKICNKTNETITDLTNSDDYASMDEDESCDTSNSSVTGSESSFNRTNENLDNTDCGNNSEITKVEEDVCVSFVTTRRRNGVTNNSFLTLDNSITSGSSTDFDKTVVSLKENNKINGEIVDNDVDIEGNIMEHLDKNIPTNEKIDANNKPNLSSSMINTSHDHINSPLLKIKKSVSAQKNASKSIETQNHTRSSVTYRKTVTRKSSRLDRESLDIDVPVNVIEEGKKVNKTKDKVDMDDSRTSTFEIKQGIVLQPGKRWERSLSIYRRMTTMADHFDHSILDLEPLETKGRKYRQSVISTMEMQDLKGSVHNESIHSRRSTFVSKPSRPSIKIVRESNDSRISLCSTTLSEDLQGFLTDDCDDTIVELSKLSIADSEHEVTLLKKFHDTSSRVATARDYVLRRCNQTDVILFDECYPDTVLKNCRKIGEGVYGEVYLWRARDGRARVLKIVPIAGHIKVNGEEQKDYHEIISEIVIAMELSALRAPIPIIEQHFDEGKSVETLDLHSVMNATDVFNEVLAVRCVKGNYPSRLLDLWELYDETKGSENDTPAVLPHNQHYLVLELANAGQDLESYEFVNAEQAYALFKQVAFGLAVGEEAFQFEHRDLHWGNVLIAPTDQKYAHFVLRGRQYSVPRRGVAATVIDYSLSRVSLPRGAGAGAGAGADALFNDLADDETLFDAVGDYQFEVYRLMREKLGNNWKNFEPYTNILWLHYTVDKMITALRYTRTNTKIHKQYISKLKDIKNRILDYGSAVQYVLTDNEL